MRKNNWKFIFRKKVDRQSKQEAKLDIQEQQLLHNFGSQFLFTVRFFSIFEHPNVNQTYVTIAFESR